MSPYNVPFCSQQSLIQHRRKERGCGIAALKMLLDYWHQQSPALQTADMDVLYSAGEAMGAHNPDIGWMHPKLAELARSYGYESYNVDVGPKSSNPKGSQDAWDMLRQELDRGPVMASVYSGFDRARGGGHLVVVTGAFADTVYLNDPQKSEAKTGVRAMPLDHFLHAFKHRYIVVRPAS